MTLEEIQSWLKQHESLDLTIEQIQKVLNSANTKASDLTEEFISMYVDDFAAEVKPNKPAKRQKAELARVEEKSIAHNPPTNANGEYQVKMPPSQSDGIVEVMLQELQQRDAQLTTVAQVIAEYQDNEGLILLRKIDQYRGGKQVTDAKSIVRQQFADQRTSLDEKLGVLTAHMEKRNAS